LLILFGSYWAKLLRDSNNKRLRETSRRLFMH
jgi:hypothetical protein